MPCECGHFSYIYSPYSEIRITCANRRGPERRVCDLSKGLVEVVHDDEDEEVDEDDEVDEIVQVSRVQFVHQSVQDFLLEKGFRILDDSSVGTVVGRGHFWFSRSCIKYLSMEAVQSFADSVRKEKRRELRPTEVMDMIKDDWPLLSYSLDYSLLHAKEVENANMPQDDLAALHSDGILQSCLAVHLAVFGQTSHPKDDSLLHMASQFNLIHLVNIILGQNVHADQKDDFHRTPLSIATQEGHEILTALLVNRDDVNVNQRDILGRTPLLFAIKNEHQAVVEIILNCDDINADLKDIDHRTPVSWAASNGLSEIVELLLQHNADIHGGDINSRTPLSWAASNGHYEVVQLLHQHSADIHGGDINNRTPLLWAAFNGHYEMVELLLSQHHCNVDQEDTDGRTPLSYAAGNGHQKLVNLFLGRSDVNAGSEDTSGRNPLSWALMNLSLYNSSPTEEGMRTIDMFMGRDDVCVTEENKIALRTLGYPC